MGMFNKGGGRDDAAFEMSRDGPLIKLGAIVIGVILVLALAGCFPSAGDAHRGGTRGRGDQPGAGV